MRRWLKILVLLAGVSLATMAAPAELRWEPAAVEADAAAHEEPRAYARGMYVHVELPERTQVKVVTILGQPVAQARLEAGAWRMRMPSRGIYILRAGTHTCRITI